MISDRDWDEFLRHDSGCTCPTCVRVIGYLRLSKAGRLFLELSQEDAVFKIMQAR